MRPVIRQILFLTTISATLVGGGLLFYFETHANQPARPAAERGYVPLAPLPGIEEGRPVEVGAFLLSAYQIGVSIAILLAVIMIMYAGIRYIVTSSSQTKGAAKDIIEKAFIGLLLAVGGYSLLFLIGGRQAMDVRLDFPDIAHVEPVAGGVVCNARVVPKGPANNVPPNMPNCRNVFPGFDRAGQIGGVRIVGITTNTLNRILRANITECFMPRPWWYIGSSVPLYSIDTAACTRERQRGVPPRYRRN
jgi:hypothetical protein